MSRISQDFISTVAYLYEEINIQEQDFLNEDSEYYDAEAAEIVEDILSTISASMVCEGYSAEAIIGFLSDSSEETIIEKYLNFDENVLIENTISEEYIVEQLKIFDAAINEGLGTLIGKVAKGAISLAGRVASKPARSKIAQKLATSKNPEKTRQAVQRLAQREARKGKVGGYTKTSSPVSGGKPMTGKQSAELLTKGKLNQATQKVKDVAAKAKPALQKVAKGAGIFGLGAAGGFVGAKMAGAGSGSKPTESPKPSPDAPAAPILPSASSSPSSSAPSGGGRGPASSGRGGGSAPASSTPATSKQTGDKAKDMETWAKANPKLAAKLKPDGTQKGTGQSQMEKDAEELRKLTNRSKQRQGELMGGPEGSGEINTKEVDAAIEAEKKRQQEKLRQQSNTVTTKESYEPYDILLDYLISRGHADTIEEAHYIMLEMDESAVGMVMEEYKDYLIAEEIYQWVDGLLSEGYDLSDYTWDDIVEYYVTEANRGEEHEDLSPLKKIRKRNKEYFRNNPETVQKTTQRRGEHSSTRGVKRQKGGKSAFDTMRHVGGPYR